MARECTECGGEIPDDYPAIPGIMAGQAFHRPEDCQNPQGA